MQIAMSLASASPLAVAANATAAAKLTSAAAAAATTVVNAVCAPAADSDSAQVRCRCEYLYRQVWPRHDAATGNATNCTESLLVYAPQLINGVEWAGACAWLRPRVKRVDGTDMLTVCACDC